MNTLINTLKDKRYKLQPIAASIGAATFILLLPGQQVGAQGMDQGNGASQISMCIFPVIRGEDGNQYIITKAGYKVTVPGIGISPDANEIAVYRNQNNNLWYVDRNGATQPVSQEQMQSVLSQMGQQAAAHGQGMPSTGQPNMMQGQVMTTGMPMGSMAAPGMMPQTQVAPQQAPTVVVQNQQPQQSGGGASALTTGLAAAGGAMAGSALTNSLYNNNNGYHGMPYGVPMYNQGGHYYYNGADGKPYPVSVSGTNPYANQWNQQAAQQTVQSAQQNQQAQQKSNQQAALEGQQAHQQSTQQSQQSRQQATQQNQSNRQSTYSTNQNQQQAAKSQTAEAYGQQKSNQQATSTEKSRFAQGQEGHSGAAAAEASSKTGRFGRNRGATAEGAAASSEKTGRFGRNKGGAAEGAAASEEAGGSGRRFR